MTDLELRAVAHGALRSAAGNFGPACTVVTGDDARSLATFTAVASGAVNPERGHVLLDGALLTTTPAARQRVASLLASETLPFARDLDAAVTRVLEARGDDRRAHDVLAPYGLDTWSRRAPSELDRDELRSLSLVLALAHEQASALVLYEPQATSVAATLGVETAVLRAVKRGVIVVIVSASRAAALHFGGPHCAIRAGVLAGVSRDPVPISVGLTP